MPKNDTLEILLFIKDKVEQLPTEDRVREIVREELHTTAAYIVALELGPVHQQLRDISRQLDAIEEQYRNIRGVTKKIDDLRAQIGAIKKHLGLAAEIA
jgi:hypothetical protein